MIVGETGRVMTMLAALLTLLNRQLNREDERVPYEMLANFLPTFLMVTGQVWHSYTAHAAVLGIMGALHKAKLWRPWSMG